MLQPKEKSCASWPPREPGPVLESCKGASAQHSTWAKKYCCIAGCSSGDSGLHWCYFHIWVHHLEVLAWAGASSRLSLPYFNTENRCVPTCQAGTALSPTVLSSTCFSLTQFSLKVSDENYTDEIAQNSSVFRTMVLILPSFFWK